MATQCRIYITDDFENTVPHTFYVPDVTVAGAVAAADAYVAALAGVIEGGIGTQVDLVFENQALVNGGQAPAPNTSARAGATFQLQANNGRGVSHFVPTFDNAFIAGDEVDLLAIGTFVGALGALDTKYDEGIQAVLRGREASRKL